MVLREQTTTTYTQEIKPTLIVRIPILTRVGNQPDRTQNYGYGEIYDMPKILTKAATLTIVP